MISEKKLKISIIADVQSKLNKRMKDWCSQESPTIERRSAIHGDSDVFQNYFGRKFTIEKRRVLCKDYFQAYTLEDLQLDASSIIKHKEKSTMEFFLSVYRDYANTLDRDTLFDELRAIKFVFYGLHFIDEDTVELQYGITNVVEPVDNINYIN